jgi:hypothetical protein
MVTPSAAHRHTRDTPVPPSISKSVDTSKDNDYISSLEHRLDARSEELEVIHMEAAIDAQLTDTTTDYGCK